MNEVLLSQLPADAAPTSVKDGKHHIESLRDSREVYLDGKLVSDVTTHPAYRNAVASAGTLYDYQAAAANIERMTFDLGDGHRVSRAWELPRKRS